MSTLPLAFLGHLDGWLAYTCYATWACRSTESIDTGNPNAVNVLLADSVLPSIHISTHWSCLNRFDICSVYSVLYYTGLFRHTVSTSSLNAVNAARTCRSSVFFQPLNRDFLWKLREQVPENGSTSVTACELHTIPTTVTDLSARVSRVTCYRGYVRRTIQPTQSRVTF